MKAEHRLIKTLGDAEVFSVDLETIEDGMRIKDTIIHYYGNLFQQNTNQNGEKIVRIIPPCTVLFFKFYLNEYDQYSVDHWAPLSFNFVLIPVISVDSPIDPGKHASLLLFKNGYFFHIDSHFNTNDKYAREAAKKFSIIFGLGDYKYQVVDSPQQENGYDCGVFTIAFMDYLCKEKGNFEGLKKSINQSFVTNLRHQIKIDLMN